MKTHALSIVPLLYVFTLHAVQDGPSRPLANLELREFARLPQLSIQVGFNMNSALEYYSKAAEAENSRSTEEIQQSMEGTLADAERYQELGEAHRRLKNAEDAQAAFEKAKDLAQAQIRENPENAEAHRGLGLALWGLERHEEAEEALRQSVKLNPSDWESWRHLGRHLRVRAFIAAAPKYAIPENRDAPIEKVVQYLAENPPKDEQYRLASGRLEEAKACLDRSIELNPTGTRSRIDWIEVRWLILALEEVRSESGSVADRGRNAIMNFCEDEMVSEMRKIAQLTKENPENLYSLAVIEIFNAAIGRPELLNGDISLAQLPTENRESIEYLLGRLRELGSSPDKGTASEALLGLAILHIPLGDERETLNFASQALERNPDNERAWTLTLATTIGQKDFQKIKELGLEQLKHYPTARNHLIVAKACEKLGEWSEVQAHTLSAFALDRKNPKTLLARTASIMRPAENSEQMKPAMEMVMKAYYTLNEVPESQRDKDFPQTMSEAARLTAVCLGLLGDLENARAVVRKVYEIFPEDEVAREIERALAAAESDAR